jgi:hypothetical protein
LAPAGQAPGDADDRVNTDRAEVVMARHATPWLGLGTLCLFLLGVSAAACTWERPALTALALVDDDQPYQRDRITVLGSLIGNGQLVEGAAMDSHWRYWTNGRPHVVERACPSPGEAVLTDGRGRATCTRAVDVEEFLEEIDFGDLDGDEPRILAIHISVRFNHEGHHYRTETTVMPRPSQRPPPLVPMWPDGEPDAEAQVAVKE